MTEAQWLDSTDPQAMLEFLREKASERKLRLFGCACARQVWGLLIDPSSCNAVEVAERFADGLASSKDLAFAKRMSGAVVVQGKVAGPEQWASGVAWSCTRNPLTADMYPLWVFGDNAERIRYCSLLREVFGTPFRPVANPPDVLAWNDWTIPRLAHAIYRERAFDRLPSLASALEEAGCSDADMLAHCRAPGPHVRGCWVVDFLTGRK